MFYKFQIGFIGLLTLAFACEWLKTTISNLFLLFVVVLLYLLMLKFLADKFGKDIYLE
jgi:hypothetical protein